MSSEYYTQQEEEDILLWIIILSELLLDMWPHLGVVSEMPLVWLTFVSLFRWGKLTFAVIRSFESLLWMLSCQSLSWPLTECCQSCYYSAHSSTVQAFSIQLCPLASVWAGKNAWNQRVRFLCRRQEKQYEMSDCHGVGLEWSPHRRDTEKCVTPYRWTRAGHGDRTNEEDVILQRAVKRCQQCKGNNERERTEAEPKCSKWHIKLKHKLKLQLKLPWMLLFPLGPTQ